MNKDLFNDYIKGLSITELSHKYKVSKTRVYKEIAEYSKEQEKVLNIIKEKNVDIQYLKRCKNAKQYNKSALLYEELSNEEFDLLKEVFKNE